VAVAVTHEDLPDAGESADVTGGQWVIQLLSGRKLSGLVTGGTLISDDLGIQLENINTHFKCSDKCGNSPFNIGR
jgi:hypothetical protein